MGVSFFESMQGHLTDRWGHDQPIDFHVRAEASHLRSFARTGEARLTGIVHAPPWAHTAPTEGTLTLRPGSIAYHLRFTDDEAHDLVFAGKKSLKLLRFAETVTFLPGELRRDGEVVGRGELRYDLNDVLRFAASWWPSTSIRRVEPRTAALSGPIEDRLAGVERDVLLALAPVLIPAGQNVPVADAQTVDAACDLIEGMPPHVVTLIRVGLRGVDAAARARTGRSLAALPTDRVAALLDQPAIEGLVRLLAMPLRTAHFHRPDYLAAVGAPTFEAPVRDEPPAAWQGRITDAAELEEVQELEAEVVIVGTGAGGAAMASRLAERGVAVLMLEEGRYQPRSAFSGTPMDRMRRLYRDGGLTFSVGRPPISIPLGKMVGGTTAINSGTCFRTPASVLAEWRAGGLPDDFAPEPMDPWFAEIETELGIEPGRAPYLGKIADVVGRGADAMGLTHGPLPRNAPACDGQGVCVLGCPTDAKRSTNVSYVPRALTAGAEVITGLPVTRILRRGRHIVGVEARGHDAFGRRRVVRVKAEAVVLSCGTLLTPTLLADNGFSHPWLGHNLSVHPGFGAWVRSSDIAEPWKAIPQGYSVHGFEDDGIKFEGYYLPPQLAGVMIPLRGEALVSWMGDAARVGQFGFMVRDRGVGRVQRVPGARPLVRYDLSDDSVRRLQKGAAVLAELLLRGGGEEVMLGVTGHEVIRSVAEARAFASARVRPVDFNLLGAHPLGTCRIGADPATSPLDADHRFRGTDNLYVVDGSAVPSSLGVNPQVTIMALALRAADRLAARLVAQSHS